jgi:hypothetical protein
MLFGYEIKYSAEPQCIANSQHGRKQRSLHTIEPFVEFYRYTCPHLAIGRYAMRQTILWVYLE